MTDPPRVLALVGDAGGCTLWRVLMPFAVLQKKGIFAHWKARDDPENSDTRFIYKVAYNFDAILLPRLFWHTRSDAERFIKGMHRAGLAIIVETDDDVYSPSINARIFGTQEIGKEKGLEKLEEERLARIEVLQMCDGVTVTSQRLKTIVSQFTEAPIEIIPNAPDCDWFAEVISGCTRVIPPLTVGWAGGSRYYEDLAPVAEAWHTLARRYPSLQFVVQGHMAEILIDAVPPGRCRRLPWLPLEEYPRALLNFDIGCASVAPKLFNTAKTPIKVWEYALAGVPVVASPTLYGSVIRDGHDGLLAETATEWTSQLSKLIESPRLRRRLARAQARRVRNVHSMEHNWHRWPNAWMNILEPFHSRRRAVSLLTA